MTDIKESIDCEPSSAQVTQASALSGERGVDRALRPKSLVEYVGQPQVTESLALFVKASLMRCEQLDHVLLFGPPGLGKTTLALLLSGELGVDLVQTSGPALEKPADLAALLTGLPPGAVLFIDEIHRLPTVVEELLYSAMEDCRLDIRVGEGPQAKLVQVRLEPFTLVGATTRAGALTAPLRDRFGITARLEYYAVLDLARIVERSAKLLCLELTAAASQEVALRSRGTPRIANRLLRRLNDVATVRQPGQVLQADFTRDALSFLGVDSSGLNEVDRKLLSSLLGFYGGGPVGLDTLAATTGEAADTIEDVVEPFLIQQGYLQRTPRGRSLTDLGRARAATLLGANLVE